MTIEQDAVAATRAIVAMFGADGVFHRVGPGAPVSFPVRVAVQQLGERDEVLINSYGVEARRLTFNPLPEFAALKPKKFDYVEVPSLGERLVIETVHQRIVAGVTVRWTAYSQGGRAP